jgi:hypothetical protein
MPVCEAPFGECIRINYCSDNEGPSALEILTSVLSASEPLVVSRGQLFGVLEDRK